MGSRTRRRKIAEILCKAKNLSWKQKLALEEHLESLAEAFTRDVFYFERCIDEKEIDADELRDYVLRLVEEREAYLEIMRYCEREGLEGKLYLDILSGVYELFNESYDALRALIKERREEMRIKAPYLVGTKGSE